MSIGNVKTSGSKGTNYPWQYAMLKTLTAISTSLGAGTEFESRLVRLIAAPYTLYLEVRLWDTDSNAWSGTPTYYEVGSNTPVILAPGSVEYADEDNALVLTAIKTATETTALETASIDTNTAGILADTAVIETNTTSIDTATATLGVTSNTAFMVRGTGAVTVLPSVKSISVYNAGGGTGTITIGLSAAADLLAGETVNFDAGGNGNKFPASHFVVDGVAAADMLIIYVY